MDEETIERIVENLLRDLANRLGLENAWNLAEIGSEAEIRAAWSAIIRSEEAPRILSSHSATLEADAARYRYLKLESRGHSPHMQGFMRLYTFQPIGNPGGAPDLDSAIDMKIKAIIQ